MYSFMHGQDTAKRKETYECCWSTCTRETTPDLRYDSAGFLYSFVMFAVRSAYQIVRNSSLLATDVAMQFFAGCVIGILYKNVNFKNFPSSFHLGNDVVSYDICKP